MIFFRGLNFLCGIYYVISFKMLLRRWPFKRKNKDKLERGALIMVI